MDPNPKVTVMMPVYNGMPLIKLSIGSLLRQSYQNWECIIVDDGSNDGTAQYIDSLEDPRFLIHHFDVNKGRPIARQKALEMASGQYLAMLDADDLYHPEKLALQVRFLEQNPEVALISSAMCSFGMSTDILRRRGATSMEICNYNSHILLIHAASMMRTDRAKQFQYNPTLKLGQDVDFLRKYLKGQKLANSPKVLYYYSEFDSVNKHKILNAYRITSKAYIESGDYLMAAKNMAKYLIQSIRFCFMSKTDIIKSRGTELNDKELADFNQYVKPYLNF